MEQSPPGVTTTALDTAPAPASANRSLRRLMWSLLPTTSAIFLLWGMYGILLPAQIQELAPESKETTYAWVAALGAALAMIAQPVAGVVSDRTRSRFGRRAPWMVGSAIVGGVALLVLGSATVVIQVAIAWCVAQVAYNFVQGPLSAVMPDRVPVERRGLFASITGVGTLVGMMAGQIAGAKFVPHFMLAWTTAAAVVLVLVLLFVMANPDRDNRLDPRNPFDVKAFLRTFWVSPRQYPDFGWAFLGRFMLTLGFTVVTTYSLYISQDYIGLSLEDALDLSPKLAALSLVGMFPATIASGILSDRVGRRRIFVFVACVILAGALAVPFFFPTVTGITVYSILVGIGYGMFQSVDSALISEVLPSSQDFGKDLGILNIAATLPQALAPALAGLIVVSLGGYAALYPWAIAFVAIGGVSVWFIKSVK
ncbi:MFS family permease [Rhodococcus sp. LBL1]|nr:MFS family permease [Rhodococcus sp. LBL1]MDH6682845.1 MFS family permease [Rhodococcus sp. LBL2]